VKVAFALAIQILLAQVGVAALQNRGQEPQLILFAERRHMGLILQLHLRIDNRADLFRIENVDARDKRKVGAE